MQPFLRCWCETRRVGKENQYHRKLSLGNALLNSPFVLVGLVQLTFDKGDSWPFGWSPDGERIAFAGSRNGIWNVGWITRSDKLQKPLTRNTSAGVLMRFPAWSPLGNQIVYEQVELTSNVYVTDLK